MAEALRYNALAFALEPVAIAVLCTNLRPGRTGHIAVNARHGQAALNNALGAFLLDNFRIYQFDHFLGLLVHIQQHDNAAQDAHLRCCQTNAAGVLERLTHIVDQRMQAVVKLLYLAAVL